MEERGGPIGWVGAMAHVMTAILDLDEQVNAHVEGYCAVESPVDEVLLGVRSARRADQDEA